MGEYKDLRGYKGVYLTLQRYHNSLHVLSYPELSRCIAMEKASLYTMKL